MLNKQFLYLKSWYFYNLNLNSLLTTEWVSTRFSKTTVYVLFRYATYIQVPYFKFSSVFGLSLLIAMIFQLLSGVLLSFYYVPDPSFIIVYREDYLNEVFFYNYFYKMHVLGVDIIFTMSYLHLVKKIYIKNYMKADADGWITGMYAFLIYHVVVFLGITLSTNHLGDVTVTIAAGIFASLLNHIHKVHYFLFTNKHLNADQLVRFMIFHYVIAYYYLFLVQTHTMYIHESWDSDSNNSTSQDNNTPKLSWLWDAINKEVLFMVSLYISLYTVYYWISSIDSKPVNYSFFEQWSEAEVEDINFFAVAPHWYFRPLMGLLTVSASHYEGLFWLGSFYILLLFLPNIYTFYNNNKYNNVPTFEQSMRSSFYHNLFFVIFVLSMVYTGSVLPCGRFYYEEEEGFFGNSVLRLCYQYIYIYLGFIIHVIDYLEKKYNNLVFVRYQL